MDAGASVGKTFAAMRRWRGLKALVHDAVDRTTELVGEGHESTSRAVMRAIDLVPPLRAPARGVDGVRRATTNGVLATIRIVNRAVEVITDVGLDAAERFVEPTDEVVPLRSDAVGSARWIGDAALGLVNGAIGDHLHARENGLDLGMQLRRGERYLAFDDARELEGVTNKIAIFVHGLGTTEWSWWLESEAYHGDAGASFGSLLARDLGFTPFWARYNTGRHVSENGRALAREIARLVERYPNQIDEIVLIGHSMGGLVVRSACWYAQEEQLAFLDRVRRVFSLGSPHHGAPLEKFGHVAAAVLSAIDTPGTRIPARLIEGRSAGIKDLRHGSLVGEDWLEVDRDALAPAATRAIPLLEHARYHFLSATITEDAEHPLGRVIGDLLVLHPSAWGSELTRSTFPVETRNFGGVLHHQIQNHPAVYEQIVRALSDEARPAILGADFVKRSEG
jgi:pimeloyl-ACP methyl ester carboxylesterase